MASVGEEVTDYSDISQTDYSGASGMWGKVTTTLGPVASVGEEVTPLGPVASVGEEVTDYSES